MKKYFNPILLNKLFIVVVSIVWIGILATNYRNGGFNWGEVIKGTGGLAWALLTFVIFISLAQKITRIHYPKFWLFAVFLPLRKNAGIFAFLVALSHGLFELSHRGLGLDFSLIFKTVTSTDHAMVFGTTSFLIMLPLFLTSTNWAVRKMGYKAWKNLQRLAHLAFVFAGLHVALINYFSRGRIDFEAIGLLLIYVAGYGYLFFIQREKNLLTTD